MKATNLPIFCIVLICSILVAESARPTFKFSLTREEQQRNGIRDEPAPWTPVDWRTLPKAQPDDQVELWYLLAPLLETDVGSLLAQFNLYHGAVAFINQRTNFTITINYDADNFFRSSLFPKFVTYPNGTKDLLWDNGGGSFIYMDINQTYWISGQHHVATVNGSIYNKYISEWNADANTTYPYYSMFGITGGAKGPEFLPSWDCFDFCWASFEYLHGLGVQFNTSMYIKRDFTDIYAHYPPVKVTSLYYSDPNVRKNIIDFYQVLQVQLNGISWETFIMTILSMFDGGFYYRYGTDYYKVNLKFPFFGFKWTASPLPGQTIKQYADMQEMIINIQRQKIMGYSNPELLERYS